MQNILYDNPTKNHHQSNNTILIRHIEDSYFTFSCENLYIICRLDLGYFNASKLCSNNNKKLGGWYRNSKSKSLLKKYNIFKVRFGNESITGHYCHPDLFINIASWISPDIYFQCCNIITKFLELKYRINLDKYYNRIINDKNEQIYKTNMMLAKIQKYLKKKEIYNDPREVIKNLQIA